MNQFLRIAENEFIDLFEQSTNVMLVSQIEKENGFQHTQDTKYISLGDTKLLQSAGITVDKSILGNNGFKIITKDNSIFVVGEDDYGVIMGVYELLAQLLNYDIIHYDTIQIDQDVTELKLKDFDITGVPSFDERCSGWNWVMNNKDENRTYLRVKYRQPINLSNMLLPIGDVENGQPRMDVHNTSEVFPKGVPGDRANWHADIGDNICYTAHGNVEDYNAMVEKLVKVIQDSLKYYNPSAYPDYKYVCISIEDMNNLLCNCNACVQSKNKYGSDSAAVIKLCNAVMEKIDIWMNLPENATYKRDDFKAVFMSYRGLKDSPTIYNANTGKYEFKGDLTIRDDVTVMLTLLESFNYTIDFNDARNDSARENAQSWLDVVDETLVWSYSTNFYSYLDMYNDFNFYPDAYKFFAKNGVKGVFSLGGYENNYATAFQGLKAYLDAKLQWDVNANVDTLIDEWFDAMFKDASSIMKGLFEKEKAHIDNLYEQMGWHDEFLYSRNTQDNACDEYWDKATLMDWINDCNLAIQSIEKYSTANPELYETLKSHIDLESLYPSYYLLLKCRHLLTAQEKSTLISNLEAIIAKYGDFKIDELNRIPTLSEFLSSIPA